MMKVLLFETMTGKILTELPYTSASWSKGICVPDDLRCSIPMGTPIVAKMRLRDLVEPRRTGIAFERDGEIVAAGILGAPKYSRDGQKLDLVATGWESLLSYRLVLPFPLGNIIGTSGKPDERWDTNISGFDLGTIIKKLVQLSMHHPGGSYPFVFEPDRVGTDERSYSAADGQSVLEAIQQISELVNGPEYEFVTRRKSANQLEALLRTGSASETILTTPGEHLWAGTGPEPHLRSLEEQRLPNYLVSRVFFTGGKDDDRMLLSRKDDSSLLLEGFPLMEVWDSSHSSVSNQLALDAWALSRLEQGQRFATFWGFEVNEAFAPGLSVGDFCSIQMEGDPWIPDGFYLRRVIAIDGEAGSNWLKITVGEATDG
ncbi:hypothetical protein [Lysinibacter cavernae]|uniref:Uncharacterized protein n=1 Tax=Lysinibacter cavernae TaxID=1640652 RepID=A0A7X5R170_9MICO|nr:hypothetical protein [Lysinibacter cavernae]NIH53748.1 hypothetical protein [Lysinibacter cavernae]